MQIISRGRSQVKEILFLYEWILTEMDIEINSANDQLILIAQ